MNLRNRITLPVVVLISTVVAGVGLVCYTLSRRALEAQLAREMSGTCEATLAAVEQWVETRRVDLVDRTGDADALAALGDGAAAEAARDRITQDYQRGMATLPGIEVFNLIDVRGDVIASSRPETVRKFNVKDRAYFREAMSGAVAVSEVLASKLTGQPIISLAVPVKEGGEVRGVLSVVLDLTAFSTSVIGRVKVLQSGYAYLYSESGLLIAHPEKARILKAKMSDNDWGRRIFEQRDGTLAYEFEGTRRIATFRSSQKLHWGLVVVALETEMLAPVRQLAWTAFGMGVLAVLIGTAITYVIARSIANPLLNVAQQLTEGANHTAAAAAQLSANSHTLADGASEQAAALEETSSSLEELASMTKHNADGSRQAKELAHAAKSLAETGATDMAEMERAMAAIKKSGDDVARIIKTIDEIAFQTNILALNAAVEAARAGEAGAGFAVVADEVRTLAQRSAQAAKETATMIDHAIANMGHGVGISARVGSSLHKIVAQVRQFDEMAGQVATASAEQSQGIGQVNMAVTQMDKVTQSNAASAEESASAAEELNTQATALSQIAHDLRAIVAGVKPDADGAASEGALEKAPAARGALVRPRLEREAGPRMIRPPLPLRGDSPAASRNLDPIEAKHS